VELLTRSRWAGVKVVSSTILPLTSGIPGKTIALTERGPWRLIAGNNAVTPDDIAYASAAGGKLWERMREGTPSAALVSDWYTDPAGNPAASGTATGSRIPIAELLARWGDQQLDGALVPLITVDAPTAHSASLGHRFRTKNQVYIRIVGAKTDTSANLTVSARQAWAVAGQKEGLITVASHAWTEGDLFYRVSDGSAAAVGKDLTGGQARVALGTFPSAGPLVNDVIRTYTPTAWTGVKYHWDIEGDGGVEFVNISMGTGANGVTIAGTGGALYFTDGYLENAYFTKGALFSAGIIGGRTKGLSILGGYVYCSSPLMSKLSWPFTLGGGSIYIAGGTLLEGRGPLVGTSDGSGLVVVGGPVACCDYITAAILDYGGDIYIDTGGAMWMRTSVGSAYGWIVNPGSSLAAQGANELPSVVGTLPGTGQFLVGGGTIKTTGDVAAVTNTAPIDVNGAYIGIES
jgi:hypothetical protein